MAKFQGALIFSAGVGYYGWQWRHRFNGGISPIVAEDTHKVLSEMS
jgi:hypothetical protein